jgi:hypothetical protein
VAAGLDGFGAGDELPLDGGDGKLDEGVGDGVGEFTGLLPGVDGGDVVPGGLV